jgi:serine/threonine-protein kinase
VRPVASNPGFDESAAALSPDGRWLAYMSDETGTSEVYVRPFPDAEAGRWQVSLDGGQAPLWAPSGRELFYVDARRNMVAVSVAGGESPGLGDRRVLFILGPDVYLNDPEYYTPFDVAPDDERFLMVRLVGAADTGRANFMLMENWFEDLKAERAE